MIAVAVFLATLAFALAWPIATALANARWPSRSPAAALALWQALAIAGALSMIGCLLAFGASPAGSIVGAMQQLAPRLFAGPVPPEFAAVHVAALAIAAGLALHLAANLAYTAVRVERERRRQHQLVQLLAEPLPGSPSTSVLAHPLPFAYCIPGFRTATVVTDGLIAILDENEVDAVVAHERAHLDQFHHLVLLAFRSWHGALPWFPMANRAERAVAQLTEMLADDAARREVGAAPLKRALELVGDHERDALAERGDVVTDGRSLAARLDRLIEAPVPLEPRTRVLVTLGIVGLLTTPVVALAAILL